jgi:hypothetical protein
MSVNEKANLPLGFLHPHRRVSLLLDLRSIPVGSVPSAILLLFSLFCWMACCFVLLTSLLLTDAS